MDEWKLLAELATWPAEEEARRMLRLVNEPYLGTMPALLSLALWAVETAEEPTGPLRSVLEQLLAMNPRRALATLVNLEDPTTEVPVSMEQVTTPDEIRGLMLTMLDDARAK